MCYSKLKSLMVVLLIVSATVTVAQEPDNLLGRWAFDGVLADSAGSVDGTFMHNGSGMLKFTEGRFGQAVELDSANNEYVALGTGADLNLGESDFTIAIWVKTTGWEGDAAIISNKDWDNGNYTGWIIAGEGGGSGSWQWNYNTSESDDDIDYDPDGPILSDGEWHHICVTVDRDGYSRYYFDGILQDLQDASARLGSVDAGYPTCVGADGNGNGNWDYWFDGAIDEVRIYTDVLTAQEVADLAELEVIPELVGHWSFDYTLEDMAGDAHGIFSGYELTYTDGIKGDGALRLDGFSDHVILGDTLDLRFGDKIDFTVALWVRTTGWNDDAAIISNKDWDSGNNTGWLIAGEGGGEGSWQWNYNTSESDDDLDYDPDGPMLSDGQWHHLCVTHDRDSVAVFYFDGIPQDTMDLSARLGSIDAGFPVVVGTDGAQGVNYPYWFKGDIDDVRLYNYVISRADIDAISEKPVVPELVGHWTFDGTLEDMAGDADASYFDQFGTASPSYAEGRYGQAVDLAQSAVRLHHIVLGDENDLNFGYTTDFTVALWVKTEGWQGDAPIITNKDWDSGDNTGWLIAGEGGGSGTWQWNYNGSESSDDADYDPDDPELSDGEWHHLCVTHDRDGYATFYFDGKYSGVDAIFDREGSIDTGYPTVIGNDGPRTYDDYFDGLIDEVRFYNYLLDDLDVAKLAETPFIESVKDVGNDQGGWVYVRFYPSLMDNDPSQGGHTYYIQRQDEDIWTSVGSAPATNDSIYQVQVMTLSDSTTESDGMTAFRLITQTNEGTWISKSVWGYSVDNIHPSVPQNLEAVLQEGIVELNWVPNEEEDFQYYGIYRSTKAGFDPDTMDAPTFKTTDSKTTDADVEKEATYYYRVAAFDQSGNRSDYSTEVSIDVTALTRSNGMPVSFQLHQNYPNPFNPTTNIRYDLPERSEVKLNIYNIQGQLVHTLVNKVQQPGYHSISWNGGNLVSGIYFYVLTTDQYTSTKKMMLVK